MPRLSVTIITLNEEKDIRDCLESVAWADEVLVVDAHSRDRTVEICQEYTHRIFHRRWQGFAAQKQFALEQARHPWVLSLDADERVTPELRDEIQALLKSEPPHDGYYIPRRSYFLGKWLRYGGWYPGYQLRLFRRDRTRVSDALVHEGFIVEGSVGRLHGDLIHLTHPTLEESFSKLNTYSTLEAVGKSTGRRIRWYDLVVQPFWAFWLRFVVRLGFLDGMHGFLMALVAGMVKAAVYMKTWERQHQHRTNGAVVGDFQIEELSTRPEQTVE
jgi:glycosyltransferase involved in cell wall biosynthesis